MRIDSAYPAPGQIQICYCKGLLGRKRFRCCKGPLRLWQQNFAGHGAGFYSVPISGECRKVPGGIGWRGDEFRPGIIGLGRREGSPLKASLTSAGIGVVAVTAAFACIVSLLLVMDAVFWSPMSHANQIRVFQHAVGGLGMGAAATPAWNILHYDPRLQAVDDSNLWPIPGSYPYSPTAASSAIAIRELPRDDLRIIKISQ